MQHIYTDSSVSRYREGLCGKRLETNPSLTGDILFILGLLCGSSLLPPLVLKAIFERKTLALVETTVKIVGGGGWGEGGGLGVL